MNSLASTPITHVPDSAAEPGASLSPDPPPQTAQSELLHPDTPASGGELQFGRIAFYGRMLEEYEWFFNFQIGQLAGKRVLDSHARASSFTAEAVRRGVRAIAQDPLFDRQVAALNSLGQADVIEVLKRTMTRPELYNFDFIKDFDDVRRRREIALDRFARDYPSGCAQGRYVAGQLPYLPFNDASFDLVLNQHYLFLYAEHFSFDAIFQACLEMARVCDFNRGGEVRIYPILGHNGRVYPYLQRLRIDLFLAEGISAEVVEIPFQYLKGSNQMLILHRR